MERTAGCAPLGRALAAEDQCVTHVLALGSMGRLDPDSAFLLCSMEEQFSLALKSLLAC